MTDSAAKIHSTAIIDKNAHIATDVRIGAYSVIGADVEVGAGTRIGPHVVIEGPVRIGQQNQIYQFSSIGAAPQDKKYQGEPTLLEIGDRNTIREFCTFNRGTAQDRGKTTIGDDNWIMAYVHLAHDCLIGSNAILANAVTLAGHVTIEDYAILGGFTKIHQFCRIGAYSFCGMNVDLTRDVPPYMMVSGTPATPHGINSEGLRRHGFTAAQITNLRRAYKILYRQGHKLEEARGKLRELASQMPEIALLAEFLDASERSIVR